MQVSLPGGRLYFSCSAKKSTQKNAGKGAFPFAFPRVCRGCKPFNPGALSLHTPAPQHPLPLPGRLFHPGRVHVMRLVWWGEGGFFLRSPRGCSLKHGAKTCRFRSPGLRPRTPWDVHTFLASPRKVPKRKREKGGTPFSIPRVCRGCVPFNPGALDLHTLAPQHPLPLPGRLFHPGRVHAMRLARAW